MAYMTTVIDKNIVVSKQYHTQIHIGTKILEHFFAQNFYSSCVVIIDQKVEQLWRAYLDVSIPYEYQLLSIPAEESNKNREMKAWLEDQLLSAGYNATTTIIAIGGGVICDLVGFVAATLYRGVELILIPTTLLAMVDASIGGKVAVNSIYSKNCIGTFYFPSHILIDLHFLTTLPIRQYQDAAAEIIKYSLLFSQELFHRLQKNHWYDPKQLIDIINLCCEFKCSMIKEDPTCRHVRHLLNFGHTVGHVLETASNYTLSHGQAVLLGLQAESLISYKLGYLPLDEFEAIVTLIDHYIYIKTMPLLPDTWSDILELDKKHERQIRCVTLDRIGKAHVENESYLSIISQSDIQEALTWLYGRY